MMSRRQGLTIVGAVIALLLIGVVVIRWQLAKLGSTISTTPVAEAQTLALSAMSNVALDPSVFGDSNPASEQSKPLLDQYKDNPELVRQRALFTTTWLNAGLLAQDLVHNGPLPNRIISSSDLTQIPPEHRTDAWKKPYCVLSSNEKIVAMSSGGKDSLKCDSLQIAASTLAASTTSSQLKRLSNGVLVTVLPVSRLQN
jgi:hypothetical protein